MPDRIHRCTCAFHGCNAKLSDGLPGYMVDAKTLRKHVQADKKQAQVAIYTAAAAAEARAKAGHEARIVDALGRLTVSDPDASPVAVESPSRSPLNNAERARNIIRDAGKVEEALTALQRQIVTIGAAPSDAAIPAIDEALQKLGSIGDNVAEHAMKLSNSAHVKTPSVVEMHRQVLLKLRIVQVEHRSMVETWRELLQKRADEGGLRGRPVYDTTEHFRPLFADVKPLVQVVMLMVTVCHVILRLPRRGTYWLFSLCKYIIEFAVKKALHSQGLPSILSSYFEELVSDIPRDIRTARKAFNVDGKSTVYAVCPKCHAIYPPTYSKGLPIYRDKCNAQKHGSRCKELLTRPKTVGKRTILVPIREYVVFDFKDWLASLLSRTGYEKIMDAAWDRMKIPADGRLTDIFQGSNIRNFMGPDKKTHFSLSGGDNAGRYLFSISVDFFNPLRVMAAGKKNSVGLITLTCLNLPIEERYKPENMFTQIIPGPREPPLDAINPYLKPIVDAFLELWNGVTFTQTADWKLRLILCAIILVICDLPGARKTGGFGAFSHELFCTRCKCRRSLHTYGDYDYKSWEPRTDEECRQDAESYRNAPSAAAADEVFEQAALRYSVLLDLPYYKPSTFLVVDVMHNLFLGLIKTHFQDILGYDPKRRGPVQVEGFFKKMKPNANNKVPSSQAALTGLRAFLNYLKKPLAFVEGDPQFEKAIKIWGGKTQLSALEYIAVGYECPLPPVEESKKRRKADVARAILEWRLEQPEETLTFAQGSIFTTEEMEALWSDLGDIVKPSWVTSVPTTLSSSGPKLKSDQWRMVGSLYLPVTLIRLWSEPDISPERKDLLRLTMFLLSAVVVATSRTTSEEHCKRYLELMVEYRRELERLFPSYDPVPNHHMALHLPEFLRMYGPATGWWAFPFERVIGMLQRISANYKPGEYEETILRSWHRTSNFQGLFKKSTCPTAIQHCADMFGTLVRPAARNTLTPDLLGPSQDLDEDDLDDANEFAEELATQPKSLSSTLHTAFSDARTGKLVPRDAHFRSHIQYRGYSFTSRERHEGNSCVIFKGSSTPYSIHLIVQFAHSSSYYLNGTWLVVERHQQASATLDPYSNYPELGTALWGRDFETKLEVKPLSEVDAHFAKCAVPAWNTDKEVVVVVALRRDA